jgi:hypothetical protein
MCRILGCTQDTLAGGRFARRFATLCNAHKSRERRHGDAQQRGILTAYLEPFLRTIDRRRNDTAGAALWGLLEARWAALVGDCQRTLAAAQRGAVMSRWDRLAAAELVRVADAADVTEVWRTAAAMVLMREVEPHRFRSDRAFLVQMGRRVRHLAGCNVGVYWNSRDGRPKHVYRDPNPKTAARVGQMLADAFGAVGVTLAREGHVEAEREAEDERAFRAALRGIAPSASLEGHGDGA